MKRGKHLGSQDEMNMDTMCAIAAFYTPSTLPRHQYCLMPSLGQVDLKIPGQVDHSLLPADALPQIVSLLSE
eukprot:scaffold223218_cov14-Tisochrysis_lutea.AAC.1